MKYLFGIFDFGGLMNQFVYNKNLYTNAVISFDKYMTTLVLNIDRDNDFGRKANVKSPIIGLDNNLEAANKLAQVDPEDSDVNAIFLAISKYSSLL